jgi:hypothetical protein
MKPNFTHFLCPHDRSLAGYFYISMASLIMGDGKCGCLLGLLSCQFRCHARYP